MVGLEVLLVVLQTFVCSMAQQQKSGAWELMWEDDFSGGSLDTSIWKYEIADAWQYGYGAGWGNGEAQFYTADNVKVEDGVLKLTAMYEPPPNRLEELCWQECYDRCKKAGKIEGTADFDGCMSGCGNTGNRCANVQTVGISSGRIYSQGLQLSPDEQNIALKVEARIKADAGLGLWPAFWMLPWVPEVGSVAPGEGAYGPWSSSGEIDIMETANQMDFVNGSIHFGGSVLDGQNKMYRFSKNLETSTADDYHTFGVEWQQGLLRWYVDDVTYGCAMNEYGPDRLSSNPWFTEGSGGTEQAPFDKPFYIILNLAVGGAYPQEDAGRYISIEELQSTLSAPKTMYVDSVRVYKFPKPV